MVNRPCQDNSQTFVVATSIIHPQILRSSSIVVIMFLKMSDHEIAAEMHKTSSYFFRS
jgi:hypothetical protein